MTIDSINTLNSLEKYGMEVADSLLKVTEAFQDFGVDKVVTYFEGKVPDTSTYYQNKDTIFYLYNNLRDTHIIVKLTNDNLIIRSLAGINSYASRVKR